MTDTNPNHTRDITLETAKLGVEAEGFLRSSFGKYLIERADMQMGQAVRALIDADPMDGKLNYKLRNDIKVCEQIKQWIGEAVSSGKVAHGNLTARESPEE